MSDTTHRIHLRRPWRCRVVDGRICWSRRFGRPTRVPAGEQVWLVMEDFPSGSMAVLNGEVIPPAAVDVTGRLQTRNELTLTVPAPSAAPGLGDDPPGRVMLQIRRAEPPQA